MRCEENNWNIYFCSLELVLKVQATNAGKSYVQNEATRTITSWSRQELLCGPEGFGMQADRLQQFLERLTYISIVIDNEYVWHILCAHNAAPQSEGNSRERLLPIRFCHEQSSAS